MIFLLYFFIFLIIVIAVLVYSNDFSLAFRSSKVKKIADEFNLSFEKGDPNANLFENKSITFNKVNGTINNVPVTFYDSKTPFSISTLIKEEIDKTKNITSNTIEKIAPAAMVGGVGVLPYFYRSGMERISYMRIGDVARYIGYRSGTIDLPHISNTSKPKTTFLYMFRRILVLNSTIQHRHS